QALKLLKASYFEQVKMIYIDPPYNTKSENFIYRDNFTASEDSILDELGYSADYKDYIKNIQGARTHSGWLSFMFPRLLLARDLLKDDGVIFISIDENEQANLKLLCDEVFGEANFVAGLPVVMNLKGNQDNFGFADTHEYCCVYAKNKNSCVIRHFSIDEESLDSDWQEDDWGLFKKADTLRRTGQDASRERRKNGWFPVFIDVEGGVYATENNEPKNDSDVWLWPINSEGEELSWSWSKNKINTEPHNLIVIEGRDGKNVYKKQRPQLGDLPTSKPKTIWYKSDYSTSTATTQLKKLLTRKVFQGPKPVPFIKDLLTIGSDENSLILDFFAGSGTTGQAVMELNAEDGGKRKFILVQLPEAIDAKKQKDAYEFVTQTLGKPEATIFEITAERLRRAGEKIKKDHADKEGIANLDIGFKAFALADDPMQQFYKPLHEVTPEDLAQLEIALSSERLEASLPTILVNLLLAEKLPVSTPIIPLVENALYQAANVLLIVNDLPIERIQSALSETQNRVEYVSIYSPNISGAKRDQFSQELKPALAQMGLDESRLRFRG
ncbi:MAG: site-specific DNA-methyltransferase, partial [Gammaproteobacteria bacterium]|nr:site-specific DNA-methyltransferase [Gammaproteobacteria bacterium]